MFQLLQSPAISFYAAAIPKDQIANGYSKKYINYTPYQLYTSITGGIRKVSANRAIQNI